MFTETQAYYRDLGSGLALQSVSQMQDVERVAALSGAIHGPVVANLTRELILNHPHTRPEHWLYVEDTASRQAVSITCLIPWTFQYGEILLRSGEVGIVATHPDYRHRGLVRALMVRHEELLREGDYDLGHIQGIPYFYRQFGYEYAMPLEGGWRVDLHLIPDSPAAGLPCRFRLATTDDLPVLIRLYDQAAADLDIHVVRDEATWRYLLGPSTQTETAAETWLVLDEQDQTTGYVRVSAHGFGEGLHVSEVSCLSSGAAWAVLCWLKTLSTERGRPYIRLNLPAHHILPQVARCSGAHDLGHYAWQIKLVDVQRLLTKIAPVLEQRLQASPLAGITQEVILNLYREAFLLCFHQGRLHEVRALGFSDEGGIRVPPLLLAPLLLGYRSREELAQAHHDFTVDGELQPLVDVLFCKMDSFLYTNY